MDLTDFLITFFSQLSLLLIGWFLAKRTVNSYQKSKEHKEIRESMIQSQTEVFTAIVDLLGAWNDCVEHNMNKKSQSRLSEAFIQFAAKEALFFNRIDIQFELNDKELTKIEIVKASIQKMGEEIQETGKAIKKREEFTKTNHFIKIAEKLKPITDILLTAKIK